jgi:hypothetical protein
MKKHQLRTLARLRGWGVKHANRLKTSMQQGLKWKSGKGQPGGRFSGRLSQSIAWSVRETAATIDVNVGPGVPYGKYIEGWNKAGEHKPVVRRFLKFETAPDLKKWLVRHGVKVSPKAEGWMVGGPDSVTPFAEPAFRKHVPSMKADLANIIRQ